MADATEKLTRVPRHDSERVTLPRREWGGYHVKLDGETVGWVVKDREGRWDAYLRRPGEVKGHRVVFSYRLRRTAVDELMMEARRYSRIRWDAGAGRWYAAARA